MVEQQKSYEHVLTYLEDALRDGKLTLGQSLPPERELAEQLGISRNSVREAVRLLEHMGFLVSSQGAGNFISCNIQRNLQDSFDMLILLQQIDYHQLAELRSGLELQAALLAVDRIIQNPRTGNQLQYAHEQMVDALRRRDKTHLMLAVNHHFNVVNSNMTAEE